MNLRNLVGLALALITVVMSAGPAAAQGTFGSLPDPISSRDLDRYAERLALSAQQQQAVSERHAVYLSEFRTLREDEIERFLNSMQGLMRNFDLSQRREVEQAVRTLNRLMGRIRALDEQLFDDLQTLLTDEQLAQLPRVRLQRERQRYASEMTRGIEFINPAVRLDLSELVNRLNLSPDALDAVDGVLESYERRLTAASRRVFDATTDALLDALKRLEELGFNEGQLRDPATALRLFEAFQGIWGEVTADVLKEAADVSALHRSTHRSLSQLLPRDAARELRLAYHSRAYPEAAGIGRAAWRQFEAAMDMPELSADLQSAIEALAFSHEMSQLRITEQVIDLLDARRRDIALRDLLRRNSEDERTQAMDELRARADQADEAALSNLHNMLGPELAERVQSRRAQRGGSGPSPWRQRRGGGSGESRESPLVTRVPNRITTQDLARIGEQLNLDDSQRAVLEAMHEAYLDRFRAINEQHITPLRGAARNMVAFDFAQREDMEDQSDIVDEVFAMQRVAFEAVRELDEAFFEDLRLALAGPETQANLERLRLQRERAAYVGDDRRSVQPGSWGRRGFSGDESAIDISHLLMQLQLDGELDEDARRRVLEYEREVTGLFRAKYDADLEMFKAMQSMAANRGDRLTFRDIMRTAGRATAQANTAVATLNRATFNALRESLPPTPARELEYRYRVAAFPGVSDDSNSADGMIEGALALPDVADGQRSRLRELAGEYRAEYAVLNERMYELYEELTNPEREYGSEEARIQWREVDNELDRLRFERNELNEKARRQLRAILSDAQVQRLAAFER